MIHLVDDMKRILLAAFDALDAPLTFGQDAPVATPGHDWAWCRERLVAFHTVGDWMDGDQVDTVAEWVVNAHQQIEADFLEEEGDDADGRAEAHLCAVEELTTLLARAWWDTTRANLLVLILALGELTGGRVFPFPLQQLNWPLAASQLRSWLHAAYDAHQLLVQQGNLLCEQPGIPDYQPPEEERLDWD